MPGSLRKHALALLAALAAVLGNAHAEAQDETPDLSISGQLRLLSVGSTAAGIGPLAAAQALHPGIAAAPGAGATLALELRATAQGWSVQATQQQALQNGGTQGWVNALAYAFQAGDWQLSAGRQVVGWDVGYAFRPNDFIQQESRRTLVEEAPVGRAVVQAQRFGLDRALSLVLVNPQASADARGAEEPALAARYYQRAGAADWFAFARNAQRTGASLGAALAWVASDALELHTSWRWQERGDTLAADMAADALLTRSPWQASGSAAFTQALVGLQWTHPSNLGVLLEAWWDGSALSDAQWRAWRTRNQALQRLAAQGAPAAAVAGNLAWQADALGASDSLRRSNLLLRLAWSHAGWEPALDWLLTPEDGGQVLTAMLRHPGDRVQLQVGWRVWGGPDDAVLAQLPQRSQVFAQARWAF